VEISEILKTINKEYLIENSPKNLSSHIKVTHTKCKNTFRIKLEKIIEKNFICPFCSGKVKKDNKKLKNILKNNGYSNIILLGNFISWETKILIGYKNCNHTTIIKPYYFLKKNSKLNTCNKCSISNISHNENNLFKFISNLLPNVDIIRNSHSILPTKKEIDIYIPELKLAFEYDGIYFHSDYFNKDIECQLSKYIECKKLGIRLIQIFSDEYNLTSKKRKICQIKIKHLLGLNNSKIIHTRKCEVYKNLNQIEKKEFLENNELRGNDFSDFNYYLKKDNEILAILTFKKIKSNYYEILRFTTNINYRIPGAFSKLWNFFLKDNTLSKNCKVIVKVDVRWNSGNIFKINGFKLKKITKPDFKYLDYKKINRIDKNDKFAKYSNNKIWNCGYYIFQFN